MNARSLLPIVAMAVAVAACAPAGEPEPRPPQPAPGMAPTEQEVAEAAEDFQEIRTGFLEWYFEAHPVRATELGMYDHDGRLPALDRAGVQRRIDDLLEWLADLEQIRFDAVEGDVRYDYAILEYGIRAELLELEEARGWANDPILYTEIIARGLAAIATREYAPFAQRAESLTRRMTGALELLEAARANVDAPPELWTRMAIEATRGLIAYVEDGLPATLAEQHDGELPTSLETARSRLAEALRAHTEWLADDLAPRSTGTYRLGRYLMERKLLYSEHVSLRLRELEALNTEAIREYRRRVTEVAREIDPDRTAREIIDSIAGVGPSPDELLSVTQELVTRARDWTVESGVVEVLRETRPTVRPALPFERVRFASLDAPGPFGAQDLEAFLALTNADLDWTEAQRRQHMTYFSRPALVVTTLEQTFPGHYVERQYETELTELRRVFATRSFRGGWAHYAAEMALDEGFSDDPGVRLEQLRRALQHHARWYAVFHLHAGEESLDEVVSAFTDIAYTEEAPARREVLHATRAPTYMTDALGRMQIFELRDDYKAYKEEGREEFSLAEFHGRLLELGLPFTLAREALMPRRTQRRLR